MLQFLLTLAIITGIQAKCKIDDSPFHNFTWKMDEVQGDCIHIKAMKLEKDKKMYEGRWYAVYYGFSKDQAETLNCFCWDTFFDKEGRFHNSVYIWENGTYKFLRDIGDPVDPKNGIYEFNAGQNKAVSQMFNTFFYIDKDIYAFWEVECVPGKKIRRQELAIGFRHLADIEKNKAKVDEIYNELEKRGGSSNRFKARHEHCHYPPLKTNPYTNCKKKDN